MEASKLYWEAGGGRNNKEWTSKGEETGANPWGVVLSTRKKVYKNVRRRDKGIRRRFL